MPRLDHWDVIDDLSQDVWIVVLSKASAPDGFDPVLGTPERWVLGIAKHIAAKHGYRQSRGRAGPLTGELVESLLDLASDPSAACEESDARERLRAAIEQFAARLSEPSRRIFQMRLLRARLAAIANATGLSVGAVKVRLHSMYHELREELQRRGTEAP